MKLPTLFKQPTYKRFEYKPRTFDAEKEAILKRQAARKMTLKEDINDDEKHDNRLRKQYIRNRFAQYRSHTKNKNNTVWLMLRVFLILIAIGLIVIGIGQFLLNLSADQWVWNNYLSYFIILICIIYFSFRIEKKMNKN